PSRGRETPLGYPSLSSRALGSRPIATDLERIERGRGTSASGLGALRLHGPAKAHCAKPAHHRRRRAVLALWGFTGPHRPRTKDNGGRPDGRAAGEEGEAQALGRIRDRA